MKTPKFFCKISAALTPRPKKRLQASARAARPMDDYDEEEPTTNLSSAFIVVLILHVVAVGGIYAFNSIKASRKERDGNAAPASDQAAPAAAVAKAAPHNDAPSVVPPVSHQPAPLVHLTEPAQAPAAGNAPSTGRQYQVKAGDTLAKIAFAYSVTPAAIIEANHLKDNVVKPGQTLAVPAAKAPAKVAEEAHKTEPPPKQADVAPTATTPGFYTVKKGDTPTSIAHNYGVSVESLLKTNKITDPKKLQLGQTLKLPPRKS